MRMMGRARLAEYYDHVVRLPSDEIPKDLMIDDILFVAFRSHTSTRGDSR